MMIKLEIFSDEIEENYELAKFVKSAQATNEFSLFDEKFAVRETLTENFGNAFGGIVIGKRNKITIVAEMLRYWNEKI